MHINTYIKFSAVTFSSALMLGCSSVGTYYPKSSTHIPKSNSETQGATTVARLPVEASSIEFLKSQPSSGISQAPTLSIELSPDIVPVEY